MSTRRTTSTTNRSQQAVLQHNLGDIKFCTTREPLTLGDILSRLRQTMHSFQGITGMAQKWFPTTVTTYAAETHFLLFTKPPDEVLKLVDQRSVTVQPMPKGWPNLTTTHSSTGIGVSPSSRCRSSVQVPNVP